MRKMKPSLVMLFLLLAVQLEAQDFPFHYFTHLNPMVNNPSLAADEERLNVNIANYNMWAGGFKPLSDYLVSFSTPFSFKRNRSSSYQPRVGLGAVLLREDIGPFSKNIFQLVYSYHIPLSRTSTLSLGINGIVENIVIDVNSLTPLQGDDPRLRLGNNNSYLFDGGFGASIKGEDYRVMFSILNLAPSVFKFSDGSAQEIKEYRKFFLSGNYSFDLSDDFKIQPGISLRNTIQNKFGYDAMLGFDLYFFTIGAGYRSENNLFVFTRIDIQDFVLSYTSENPLSSNHMMGNGHTFSLGWSFDLQNRR